MLATTTTPSPRLTLSLLSTSPTHGRDDPHTAEWKHDSTNPYRHTARVFSEKKRRNAYTRTTTFGNHAIDLEKKTRELHCSPQENYSLMAPRVARQTKKVRHRTQLEKVNICPSKKGPYAVPFSNQKRDGKTQTRSRLRRLKTKTVEKHVPTFPANPQLIKQSSSAERVIL